MKTFQRFVALRYIRDRGARREGRAFVRFVTLVGIGGVAVGVAALILALSIVHGFSSQIEAKILGFGADIQVESQVDRPITGASGVRNAILEVEEVAQVRPVLQEFVLFRRSGQEIDGVLLNGVGEVPGFIASAVVEGRAGLSTNDGQNAVVIGRTLAQKTGISVGDKVVLISFRGEDEASPSTRPRFKQFRVGGIYQTSLANFDETFVYAKIEVARSLLSYSEDEVSRFDVDLVDEASAESVVLELGTRLAFPVMSRTIREVYRSLFAWVNLQESIIPVVIGFIVLVAIFNMGGILLMLVIEKSKSLGILTSLGASRKDVRDLVIVLGLAIGVIGVVVGELLALGLALIQQRFQVIPLPPDAYYMTTAPIELNPVDFVVIGFATVLLCVTFAYIPARVAASMDPIRVIRFR
ncbi:MAG: ABC transporter permease [Rhodothermia bacterium]|nr:ABC transporter permease [Rhodothermia bacterium]